MYLTVRRYRLDSIHVLALSHRNRCELCELAGRNDKYRFYDTCFRRSEGTVTAYNYEEDLLGVTVRGFVNPACMFLLIPIVVQVISSNVGLLIRTDGIHKTRNL